MERRCDRCGKPGQGPFDRFHVGGRVWVGWDCMSVEEQRRERMVCERCEADVGVARPDGAGQAADGPRRERIESAVQEEIEEFARLRREIEDLNRSLGTPAEPTGGE